MRFSIDHDETLKNRILSKLDQLGRYDQDARKFQSFGTVIVHAKMILVVLPKVDEKISAIQASPTPTWGGNCRPNIKGLRQMLQHLRGSADCCSA